MPLFAEYLDRNDYDQNFNPNMTERGIQGGITEGTHPTVKMRKRNKRLNIRAGLNDGLGLG